MAKLLGIAIKTKSRAAMKPLEEASIGLDIGVKGDYRGNPGPRQVTVLARESWDAVCRELDASLAWTTRRANLLVEGVNLENSCGKRLRIGAAELEITGETVPCARMDEQHPGLREALVPSWRGGVTCRVMVQGVLRPGEPVTLVDRADAPATT